MIRKALLLFVVSGCASYTKLPDTTRLRLDLRWVIRQEGKKS